ncbi:MAG: hypothetical protein HKM07_02180, partial [Chlamydiae bacterium]|nr:hypothetical protein [Chlamydiota bacterium]
SRVTGVSVVTDLHPSPSANVATGLPPSSSAGINALGGTGTFSASGSPQVSSMAAPSSLAVPSSAASAAAPKKFYVVSHMGGSQHEISPTEEKAKAVYEKVQVEFEALCVKIRQSKGASFGNRDIDINVTRGTYRYLEGGITIEEPLEDLQRPVDFVSPSGSTDVTVLNQEYKKVIGDSLEKIETLLRESKVVNFGGAALGPVVRPSSTYYGSSTSLDSASTPSLGAVVKKSKKDGTKFLEYYPEIMKELPKETLPRVLARFNNIQKYHQKFLDELETLPDAKTDKNLVALSNAMRDVDWFAVAVGIAFRELTNDQGIKKQDLEKAKKAIEAIAEKERAELHKKGGWISRIRSLPDVSEAEERARLGYEARLTDVISGKGQKKSVEEVLVTIACMENTARNNNIPWASVFDGVSPSAARAIKHCDDVALGVVTSTMFLEQEEGVRSILGAVDEKDPATLVAFVDQMTTRLNTPPSSQATELFESEFHRATTSLQPVRRVLDEEDDLSDGELYRVLDDAAEDMFGSPPRRRVDSDMSSLIDMRSDAEAGSSSRTGDGQPRYLLDD